MNRMLGYIGLLRELCLGYWSEDQCVALVVSRNELRCRELASGILNGSYGTFDAPDSQGSSVCMRGRRASILKRASSGGHELHIYIKLLTSTPDTYTVRCLDSSLY